MRLALISPVYETGASLLMLVDQMGPQLRIALRNAVYKTAVLLLNYKGIILNRNGLDLAEQFLFHQRPDRKPTVQKLLVPDLVDGCSLGKFVQRTCYQNL